MTKHLQNNRVTISHEEINDLPLGAFDGTITVITQATKLPKVFDEIAEHKVVGFDTETRPAFVRGQVYKVALMQIALPDKVFLIRLQQTGITEDIVAFLENEKILKAGVALRDDIKALQKLRKFKPGGVLELAELSKKAGLEVESVKKLSALLLGFRISKSAQTSNWEAETLNEKQISYAATDAWVCLKIYERLHHYLHSSIE
jgi:ribonuclease D